MSHVSTAPEDPRHSTRAAARRNGPEDQSAVAQASIGSVAKVLVFPIYFVIVFSFCYISAFHDPAPLGAPIAITGSPQVAQQVAAGIEAQPGDAFDVRVVTDPDQAVTQVQERDLVGALVVDPDSVTTLVAGGDGSALAGAVRSIGSATVQQVGGTAVEEDLAPLADGDTTGSALFYFVIVCTIGGYLTMTVISQALPTLRRRRALGTLAVMSVLTPVLSGLIASIFVGTLGAGFGTVVAVLGTAAVYAFTVGCLTYACNKLFGSLAIMVVLLLVVFLNFPSAGGGIPGYFLPGFWQVFHEFWFGAAVTETVRNLIYFPDASLLHYGIALGVWFVVALTAALVVPVSRGSADTGAEAAASAPVG